MAMMRVFNLLPKFLRRVIALRVLRRRMGA
jgi:hypothetical protein